MKQIIEGWTVGAKLADFGEVRPYFMGTRKTCSGNKYVTLEAYPTHINVLKNLHETKEAAIDFWNTGMWELCVSRESVSIVPVKIKVDIDVMALGLDWNGI